MKLTETQLEATLAAAKGAIEAGAGFAEHAARAATRLFEDVHRLPPAQAHSELSRLFKQLYPRLSPEEYDGLAAGAQRVIPVLEGKGERPAEFFSGEFDARAFLQGRKLLAGTKDEPVGAASLAQIFGAETDTFVNHMAEHHIPLAEAVKGLPEPTTRDLTDFSFYVEDNLNRVTNNNFKERMPMLRDIGERWPSIAERDRAMVPEDLAFKVRTGITRDEFKRAQIKPLTIKVDNASGLPSQGSATVRAFVNDYPAGSAMLKANHDELSVHLLAVNPAFRGIGIGSRMLRFTEEQAPANISQLALSGVNVDNIAARRLYTRFGYRVDFDRSITSLTMIKRLQR